MISTDRGTMIDFIGENEKTFESIRNSREFASNEIDESDLQKDKDSGPRT
jgi:hypothetical protein